MANLESVKQRWCDFFDWNKSVSHVYRVDLEEYKKDHKIIPNPENEAERVEFALSKYNRLCDKTEWLEDDTVPYLDFYTGTEIFAEAFGSKVHRTADNMPFALPFITSAEDVAGLKVPSLESSPLMNVLELTRKIKDRAGKDAILCLPDIQSPLDIAALIWDKSSMLIAMIEEPEAVSELIGKTKELLIKFLDTWFQEFGTEYIAHYPCYFMKGGLTLSEDEIGIIGSDMFTEFALPDLVELSDRYGGIGIHCCADSEHQWHNFKKVPNLRLLNLVRPADVTERAYPYFAGHTCQMHRESCAVGEAWTWPSQFSPDTRFVIEAYAKDRAEAVMIAERLKEVCQG